MARPGLDGLERLLVTSREAWRAWLSGNHARRDSIWVVRNLRDSGLPHVPVSDIVDEALCWGWIDSLPRKLDAQRSMLLLSPRRHGSAWSKVNRDKVAALSAEGRMAGPGLDAVARAKADGSWFRLVAVDTLAVPDDLARALAALPEAAGRFAAFPPSSRRAILEWIATARTDATRARRIAETAQRAAENRKANFPAGRDAGPA